MLETERQEIILHVATINDSNLKCLYYIKCGEYYTCGDLDDRSKCFLKETLDILEDICIQRGIRLFDNQ